MQEMTLDLLKEIRDKLVALEERQEVMEKQLKQVIADVNTIHQFQQSLGERLSIVEKFCLGRPLRSTPIPRANNGEGR